MVEPEFPNFPEWNKFTSQKWWGAISQSKIPGVWLFATSWPMVPISSPGIPDRRMGTLMLAWCLYHQWSSYPRAVPTARLKALSLHWSMLGPAGAAVSGLALFYSWHWHWHWWYLAGFEASHTAVYSIWIQGRKPLYLSFSSKLVFFTSLQQTPSESHCVYTDESSKMDRSFFENEVYGRQ